ncbi:centrosomal protein of 55 kDa-like isoform X2 [Syngnathoides biaculeatus]|uniref:centrosomal protein of 55 kDa-like isoform X2 n=1 Tax=Syngnathoides biaculeatus TaxID=300417 RepID=UPI002ADE947E|nr:centrosomal protein of 55 kDa-like isoform X2 [Syngnathoides biaculeatus]
MLRVRPELPQILLCYSNRINSSFSLLQDETSNEQFSSDVAVLQKNLKDALAKNHHWLAYDQQREAYVRTVVDRMLWLDKQLDQAVRAQLTHHNQEHSEEEEVSHMKEHFESLLVIGRDNLLMVKQQLDVTLHDLENAKTRYEEKENEATELKRQLQRCAEEKEEMMAEMKALRWKLDEEKRRSANTEVQSSLFKEFMVKRHNASQDKIADLERKVHSSFQDLEDEMKNCSYLKNQLVRVLNLLRRSDDRLAFYEKKKQHGEESKMEEEEDEPIYEEMRPRWTSSPNDSILDRSSLECPRCQIQCPIGQYRQMMDHLEVCLI